MKPFKALDKARMQIGYWYKLDMPVAMLGDLFSTRLYRLVLSSIDQAKLDYKV
jgi:hypothetical protein